MGVECARSVFVTNGQSSVTLIRDDVETLLVGISIFSRYKDQRIGSGCVYTAEDGVIDAV